MKYQLVENAEAKLMFETSGEKPQITIISNVTKCYYCNKQIQGSPDTWRFIYRSSPRGIETAAAHKSCHEKEVVF